MHETVQRDSERRLQTDHAERASLELLHLHVASVGGVVGGDRVHSAGDDALDHRLDIRGRPQGRLHLVVAVVGRRVLVG
jgi:hypothetical protein